MVSGECYVRGLCLIVFDFPFIKPCLENVKVVLELLQGDSWISVDCKQPGVIRKGSDGGMIGSGQVGGQDQVEQGS